ncbi:hypothetical protein Pcinc_000064 [Petrolisthes cinctipes]|uniref:Uncharacterized protein n=1 Tax=Petrolisthes cinctipes TaxID=88211 RepID=A0AAE1GQC0_PETCI|nr:hypothetical protein Pcinc_000064 [Petrolisthes cinctipes]
MVLCLPSVVSHHSRKQARPPRWPPWLPDQYQDQYQQGSCFVSPKGELLEPLSGVQARVQEEVSPSGPQGFGSLEPREASSPSFSRL